MQHWWASELYDSGGAPLVAAWVIWIVLSITLHELSHGWAAVRRGDQTPVLTGHMTFNPIVHMGVTSLVMLGLIGIAWGQMPVDPTRMRGKYAEAWVALCGPLMNFALAGVAILGGGIALGLAPRAEATQLAHFHDLQTLITSGSVAVKLAVFGGVGGMLNIALGIFNLFPFPPLDGWRIASNLVPPYRAFTMSDKGRVVGMIAFLLAFVFGSFIVIPIGWLVTMAGMGITSILVRQLAHTGVVLPYGVFC